MRTRLPAVVALAGLAATTAVLGGASPAAGAEDRLRPADGVPRATITRTAYGIPHVVADDFESLGFGRDDADVRAKILFYAGVGFGDVGPIGDRSEPARQLTTLVELLTTR